MLGLLFFLCEVLSFLRKPFIIIKKRFKRDAVWVVLETITKNKYYFQLLKYKREILGISHENIIPILSYPRQIRSQMTGIRRQESDVRNQA